MHQGLLYFHLIKVLVGLFVAFVCEAPSLFKYYYKKSKFITVN